MHPSRCPWSGPWDTQNLATNLVAQLYGGYVLPGSQLDTQGGVGLAISQWDTATGWPYRTMQLKVILTDTTATAVASKGARRRRISSGV